MADSPPSKANPAPEQQERSFDLASAKSQLEPLLRAAAPALVAAGRALDALSPYVSLVAQFLLHVWAWLKPYHPEDLAECFLGLMLLTFGGNFPTTLAAVEAFRIIGWESTRRAGALLWESYIVAVEANKKDALKDDDKDGVADVKQMQASALITHKIKVALKATDPERISAGVAGVYAGCAAVVAALRMKFALTITMGVSIGEIFVSTADYTLRPALLAVVPREYHKWVGHGVQWFAKAVGIVIAYTLQRVISAFHSALRGAELFLLGLLRYMERHGHPTPLPLSSPFLPFAAAGLGCVGFYLQWRAGFALPFPLNVLLLPVRVVEWVLYAYVASTTSAAHAGAAPVASLGFLARLDATLRNTPCAWTCAPTTRGPNSAGEGGTGAPAGHACAPQATLTHDLLVGVCRGGSCGHAPWLQEAGVASGN